MTQPLNTLDYELPQHKTAAAIARCKIHFRIALICAIAPFVVGTLIFLAILSTEDLTFAFIDFLAIGVGIILAFIAFCCIILHAALLWRFPAQRHQAVWRVVGIITIIIINFIAAFAYVRILASTIGHGKH